MGKWSAKIQSLNNENGVALVVVLVVIVIISLMGISLMGLAAGNVTMSSGERNYQSSYYIAESGVTHRMNEITPKLNNVYKVAIDRNDFFSRVDAALELGQEKVFNDFEESFGSQPVAKIKIEKLASDTVISYSVDYKITSTGTIKNRSRTVVKIFHITWKPKSTVTIPADTVLFVKDSLTLKNVPVDGSVGTNATMTEITLNGSKAIVTGNIYTNVNTPLNIPEFPIFTIPATAADFFGNSLVMTGDRAINTLTVSANNTLTIDVGEINKSLVVNNLNLQSGAKIRIIGSGKLSIYVKNISTATGSIINTDGNIEKLYMFLEGSAANISGIIYGSMYAKNSNLIVNNYVSGVQGHIITSGTSISIIGAGTLTNPKMIYAPNAAINVNSSFAGSIIAKSLTSSGNDDNFIFKFVQINYDNSPLFVDNGTGLSPVKDMVTAEPLRESN